jgi:hypothetical protein
LAGADPEQGLRRTIPSWGHVLGENPLVASDWGPKACHSEIANLEFQFIAVEQQILGFDIAVDQFGPVQIGNSVQKLVTDEFSLDRLKLGAPLQGHLEIHLHVLKNSIDVLVLDEGGLCELVSVAPSNFLGRGSQASRWGVLLSSPFGHRQEVIQSNYGWMFDLKKVIKLPIGPFGVD